MYTTKTAKQGVGWKGAVTVLVAFALLMSSVMLLNVPIALALFSAWFAMFLLGKLFGFSYQDLYQSLVDGITRGLDGILIIVAVGGITGSWMAGGIVPTVIYYGLETINPSMFLPVAFLSCAITSLITGTSFGSVATVGVAMLGVGHGFDISMPIVAGAVISGAYVGDAVSPLSDTTVLTSSLCETSLISHVKSMFAVGLPAGVITFGGFIALSLFIHNDGSIGPAQNLAASLQDHFVISPLLLLPLAITIILLALKKPALPVMFTGAFLGVLCGWLAQGMSFVDAFNSLYAGNTAAYDDAALGTMLNRGGMQSVLPVVLIIVFALGVGGLMKALGIIDLVASLLSRFVTGGGTLATSTILCGFFGVLFGGASMVGLFTASSMTKPLYEKYGYARNVLSRNCEAGGTLGCPMVPWSSNGVFMATTTGVSTLSYLPYMWYHFLFIACAILSCATGVAAWKLTNPKTTGVLDGKV